MRETADEHPFYEVELRPEGAIVRRTSRAYADLSELKPSFRAIDRKLLELAPGATTLLVDLRAIVGRNDASFESALGPMRRALLTRFARAGLLVRTRIGHMQLQRYLSADGIAATVFSDEEEAMAWFRGES